jgi:hypothetical protein
MKMFKGEVAHVWKKRMLQAGYPEQAALALALFITHTRKMPTWAELTMVVPMEKKP